MALTQEEPEHRRRFDRFCVTLALCTLPAFARANESAVQKAASHSPFARLHEVPVRAVTLGNGIWKTRFEVNAERSIPTFLGLLDEVGARDKLLGRKNKARANSDADLAKWVEAASLVLQSRDDESLRDMLESTVGDILVSAGDGCYLHTRYGKKMPVRLAQFRTGGDLYCLGHLIQAAAAYHRIAGDRRLLDVLVPYVDRVVGLFGSGKQACWSGHPEIEMALVELYRTTGEEKYLDFAGFLLNEFDHRDMAAGADIDFAHYFTGVPFRSRRELTGHAVCAMYTCCGAADYFLETGDPETWRALMALWEDLTRHKMYITGGLGSRPSDEAIGDRYELPNERGYAETCAAVGNVMWNWRLLCATGEARFADLMELALYNGVLSGVSTEGDTYFYWNPLLSRLYPSQKEKEGDAEDLLGLKKATGISLNVRQRYYRTPCCIPNIQRTIASVPGYMYSTGNEGVWVHLYHGSRLNWHAEAGEELALVQSTRYPWENAVAITFEKVPVGPFSLFLRIPGWTTNAGVRINGRASALACDPGTYCEIRRRWKQGDRVEIEFAMPVRVVHANPRVRENAGRAAIQRGPLIYCLESVDHPDVSIFDIVLSLNPAGTPNGFEVKFEQNLLGGIVTITGDALSYGPPRAQEGLYSFE
ncbi:MAG: glycoside hydrolase family 127 protein, partial [Planctomycetota bacterium]